MNGYCCKPNPNATPTDTGIPDQFCAHYTQPLKCGEAPGGSPDKSRCGWYMNPCGTGSESNEGFYQPQGACCTPGGQRTSAMYTATSKENCPAGLRWFPGQHRNTCDAFTVAPSNTIYTSCIL